MKDLKELARELTLPLIAAPMTGVSGPELMIASCLAGVVGSFPTGNCATLEELDEWLGAIQSARAAARHKGEPVGALAPNLIIRGNKRLLPEIELLGKHAVDFVITSVGSPVDVVAPLHEHGIPIIADIASAHHAKRALEAGVDGLVLLTAGAGGQTGWANGFAFARAIRATYDGPLVMAGGVSDGAALWASIVLGYDFAYMGTKFIATSESMASDEWKQKLTEITMDHIDLGIGPNGIAASSVRGGGGSAGHSVSGVSKVLTVQELVEETKQEWDAARVATAALLSETMVTA